MRIYVPDGRCGFCGDQPVCAYDASEKGDDDVIRKMRDIDHVYTYIASGSAEFIIAGVRYQLHRGNAIIIPPYMTHMIIPDGEEPFVQYIIHFDFYDTPERRALIHKDVLDEAERQLTIPPKEDLLHQQVVVSEIPESERNRLVRRYLDMMGEFQLDRPGKDIILRSECTTFLIYAWRYQIDGESRISRNPIKTKAWSILKRQSIIYRAVNRV